MPYNTSSEPLGACCLDLMLVDRRGWMSRRCFSWWRGPCGSAPVPMCFGQLSFSICFGVVAGSFAGSCQSFLGPGCIPGGRAVGQVRAGRLGSGPRAQHLSLCCWGCRGSSNRFIDGKQRDPSVHDSDEKVFESVRHCSVCTCF